MDPVRRNDFFVQQIISERAGARDFRVGRSKRAITRGTRHGVARGLASRLESDQALLRKARGACQASAFPALGECFARQMQSAGANPEAIAFMHGLHNEAYLQKFQETGRVDIGWANYPFRANENSGCLLVNGTPPQVDVDDLSQVPRDKLQADSSWKALMAKYPHATLWPGDRSGQTGVREEAASGGGQRFVVDYRVLDGCHACARLGTVRYRFDFDGNGKFQGAQFLNLQSGKGENHGPIR